MSIGETGSNNNNNATILALGSALLGLAVLL